MARRCSKFNALVVRRVIESTKAFCLKIARPSSVRDAGTYSVVIRARRGGPRRPSPSPRLRHPGQQRRRSRMRRRRRTRRLLHSPRLNRSRRHRQLQTGQFRRIQQLRQATCNPRSPTRCHRGAPRRRRICRAAWPGRPSRDKPVQPLQQERSMRHRPLLPRRHARPLRSATPEARHRASPTIHWRVRSRRRKPIHRKI